MGGQLERAISVAGRLGPSLAYMRGTANILSAKKIQHRPAGPRYLYRLIQRRADSASRHGLSGVKVPRDAKPFWDAQRFSVFAQLASPRLKTRTLRSLCVQAHRGAVTIHPEWKMAPDSVC